MSATTIRIALAGNPNSGKTSVFNALTGGHQHVGNWPGVTVEKKVGHLTHGGYDIEIVDLPGTYSLTAYSIEERVARSYLVGEKPDVVIHVVDAGNLARNLYLTVQLLELGVDLVLDLNMWDEFEASGARINLETLHRLLGTPIVTTVGNRGAGVEELLDAAITLFEAKEEHHRHVPISYGPHVDDVLDELVSLLEKNPDLAHGYPLRWFAIKLLEGDAAMQKELASSDGRAERLLSAVEKARRHITLATASDPEGIISEGRHGYVAGALKELLQVPLRGEPTDRMELSLRIDSVFTNRLLGYPIFFALVWMLFELTFKLGVYPMRWIDWVVGRLAAAIAGVLHGSLFSDLLVNGVIGGVGSIVVFLPTILILFLGIAFLEDSGYMARAAFLMDRLMHALSLHGKSFIPMLMGFGCSVPAIMAARTLESRRDRTLTILLVPLMSCSARLPVYLLVAGAFFGTKAGSVVFLMYMIGIVAALAVGRLFARTLFRSAPAPFVMELPPYRLPTPRGLFIHMWERSKLYLQKMGGVILVASVVLWVLGAFPQDVAERRTTKAEIATLRAAGTEQSAARANELETELAARTTHGSLIGKAGRIIAPVMRPLGFTWEMGVAVMTGFVAKEVVVSTLGVLYHVGAEKGGPSLAQALRDPANGITPLSAFAFMVFVLLYTPCVATAACIRREAGPRWMWFSVGYQFALAWLVSFGVYGIGRLFGLA
jgi:ferrous iron transport protein B